MLRHKPTRVLVLGHSYVCRLCDHLDATGQVNFNLQPVGHWLNVRGLGGLRFPRLFRELPSLCEAGYDVVLFDYGTNDIPAGCSPDILVDMVMSVAETLVADYVAKQVIITEIFPRRSWKYPCSPNFNHGALLYALKQQLSMHKHIHTYHHEGLVDESEQYLLDGVHLNAAGMTKYANSTRRAILKYSSRNFI